MAGRWEIPQARRPGALASLWPRTTTFLVVDAILLLTFLVLTVMQVLNNTQTPRAEPAASSSSTSEPESTPEQTAPTIPADNQALTEFVLPSGNIWCSMTETSATCAIGQFSYAAPTPTAACTGTVGSVFSVTAAEGATLPCVDAVPPRPEGATMLKYG